MRHISTLHERKLNRRFRIVLSLMLLGMLGLIAIPFGINTPALLTTQKVSAMPGTLLPPFPPGETWYVCAGYNAIPVTHSGTPKLDLSIASNSPGPTACTSATSNSSSNKVVTSPGTGSLIQGSGTDVCINFDGGGSVVIAHIGNRRANGRVNGGDQIGTVNAPNSENGYYAHIHIEARTSNCPNGTPVPFDDAHGLRFQCAPDMPYSGATNQWSGTALRRCDPDTTAPTGTLTAPADGSITNNPVFTVSADASDNAGGTGVAAVTFFALFNGAWNQIGESTTAPYAVTWDANASGVGDQAIRFAIHVRDVAGNIYDMPDAATRGVTLDRTLPTGGYDAPAANTIIKNQVTLTGHASDSLSGVDHVNFTALINGTWQLVATDYDAPYEHVWDTSGVADQVITLGFDIYDKAGNVALAPEGTRPVTKDTTAPTGALTAPANNSATSNPAFNLSANVSDNLTGITAVTFHAFYNSAWVQIGEDTVAPYEVTWDASALSDQAIQFAIHATDGAGNTFELPAANMHTVTLDRGKPTGTATLADNQPTADQVVLPIQLTASDLSGAAEVRVSADGVTWEAWQPFAPRIWWQTAGANSDTVRPAIQVRDRAGNVSNTFRSNAVTLNFYPARPASARFRLNRSVVASGGGAPASAHFQLNGTLGQPLADGSAASSTRFRATLGFWGPFGGSATTPTPTSTGTVTAEPATSTPTATSVPATPTPTSTGTVTAEPATSTPTATTVGETPTPTATTVPGSQPTLIINHTDGAAGSIFLITGSGYPPTSTLTIGINGETLPFTLQSDANGSFNFLIITDANATPGTYVITIAVSGQRSMAGSTSASIHYHLTANAPVQPEPPAPPDTRIDVPVNVPAAHIVMLPMVKR